MSMQTEIAIEASLKPIFFVLDFELEVWKDDPNTRGSLLRVAGDALQQFEWSLPDWARAFAEKWGLEPVGYPHPHP